MAEAGQQINGKRSDLPPLVIIGAGGHAVSVANVALSLGHTIRCFIDKTRFTSELLGFKVVCDLKDLNDFQKYDLVIAVGDNAAREHIHRDLVRTTINSRFPCLIHPSATICLFSQIGDGTVVMPNAIVGPNSKVGRFCLINTQSSLDHDCVMHDYSSLAPGAVTGGSVAIGHRTAICIGATIKNGVNIGDDCVIGARSYVNRSIPNYQVAYGTPAKKVRQRNGGDPYL